MPAIRVPLSNELHRALKTVAAAQGQTIINFVRETLASTPTIRVVCANQTRRAAASKQKGV